MNKGKEKVQENIKENKKKVDISANMGVFKEALINYIVPIISLALTVLIGLLILMPSYKSIPELESQQLQRTSLEANLRSKLGNMNRLVDFENVVAENSDLVNKVLVSEELVPGLLTQIDRIAKEAGLEVSRLNYGLGSRSAPDAEGTITYNTVTVNLGIGSNFAQLKTFLKNLENAARLIDVQVFRYSSDIAAGGKLNVSFVLISPYLFIESNAVTDDPIDLDISDTGFLNLINRIKSLRYYDPYDVDISVPVVETPAEGEGEGSEGEQPFPSEQPVSEGSEDTEGPAGDSIFPQ